MTFPIKPVSSSSRFYRTLSREAIAYASIDNRALCINIKDYIFYGKLMIERNDLPKHVDHIPVLVDVTFQQKGAQIAGFLCLNEPVKAMMIRIVHAFFPPKSDSSRIEHPRLCYPDQGAPRRPGSLPEKAPLSTAMKTKYRLMLLSRVKCGRRRRTTDLTRVM